MNEDTRGGLAVARLPVGSWRSVRWFEMVLIAALAVSTLAAWQAGLLKSYTPMDEINGRWKEVTPADRVRHVFGPPVVRHPLLGDRYNP